MSSIRWTILLSGSAFAGHVLAADVAPCATIRYEPNRIYVVQARLNHATHVILPESMAGKPVTGNPDLWSVDGQSTHLFIKPTSADTADGAGTTVTVVGISNTSYDFEVRRVAKGGDLCVRVVAEGPLSLAGADWKTGDERRVQSLEEQLTNAQQQLVGARADADKKALSALGEYQGRIYTQYEWGKGKGFLGKDVISDVWDDGRFTYVRVLQDNRGVMQVSARVDGKLELIEYDYDSAKKIYTIAGLYPELRLSYGKSSIVVKRADNSSAG
jgi:hypothetical protein